jgi:CYTH domain-containing protein
MPLEIERRFLVVAEGWREHCLWQVEMCQGYLVRQADGLTLRVRTSQGKEGGAPQAWITLKAIPPQAISAPVLARLEYEYPIPYGDALELLELAPEQLRKQRYGLNLPGGDWVLDVFAETNAPLVVAEVELADPDGLINLPAWCGEELTGRHQLSNAALARHPLQQWSEAELRELLPSFLVRTGKGEVEDGSN